MAFATALGRLMAPTFIAGLVGVFGAAPAGAAKTPGRPSSCSSSVVSVGGLLGSEREAEPKELPGPLEASILSSFAVFRRAAQPSDQLPALSLAGSDLDSELSSYYPGYVRQLLELSDGSRYFAIPAFERPAHIPPAQCLPRSLRSQRPKLVEEQRKRASEPVYCIVRVGGGADLGGPECEPFAEVDEGLRVFESAFSQAPIVDLVPDGVASVRIVYRTGAPIVATVGENAFVFTPPKLLTQHLEKILSAVEPGRPAKAKHLTKAQKRRIELAFEKRLERALAEAEPTKIEWLGAGGALLRGISPPSAKGVATFISVSG